MNITLIVDFGASRIKAVLWDRNTGRSMAFRETASPAPIDTTNGAYILCPEDYWRKFENTAGSLLEEHANIHIEEIWFCTEMHGCLLADDEGNPLSGYYSWKDEQSRFPVKGDTTPLIERLQVRHGRRFRELTGMRLRAGLPWVTITTLEAHNRLPSGSLRFMTLPDWLLRRGGSRAAYADATTAAGTGFFDINSRRWSDELADASFGRRPADIMFAEVIPTGQCLGSISVAGKILAAYGGIGDMQAALHGCDFPATCRTVINLGTGSQVACCSASESAGDGGDPVEIRLSCSGVPFRTLTHIPAGRALHTFASLFDQYAVQAGGVPIFWEIWSRLTVEQILEAPLLADLNIFEAAWHYNSVSGRLAIREQNTATDKVISGIARSWLEQYKDALKIMQIENKPIVICGGLSRRANFIQEALSSLCSTDINIYSPKTSEETLDGLVKIMEASNG
jgi:sugar (pentulose or hexulose) kinase